MHTEYLAYLNELEKISSDVGVGAGLGAAVSGTALGLAYGNPRAAVAGALLGGLVGGVTAHQKEKGVLPNVGTATDVAGLLGLATLPLLLGGRKAGFKGLRGRSRKNLLEKDLTTTALVGLSGGVGAAAATGMGKKASLRAGEETGMQGIMKLAAEYISENPPTNLEESEALAAKVAAALASGRAMAHMGKESADWTWMGREGDKKKKKERKRGILTWRGHTRGEAARFGGATGGATGALVGGIPDRDYYSGRKKGGGGKRALIGAGIGAGLGALSGTMGQAMWNPSGKKATKDD